VIRVPAADEPDRPIVLQKMVDIDGGTVPAFAIPIRNEDRTEWEAVDRVQHTLSSARYVERVLLQVAARSTAHEAESSAEARADELRQLGGWSEDPCVILQAQPPGSMDLLSALYGRDGIEDQVRRWSGLRNMGFCLRTLTEPLPGERGLVFGGGRWKARIGLDGWLELAVPVNFEFLGWAMGPRSETDPQPPLRINAVPLLEVTHDFFRFLSEVVAPKGPEGTWKCRLWALGMKSAGVLVHSGHPDKFDWMHPRTASTDSWVRTFELRMNPEQDAFEALRQFYGLFAMGGDDIPLTAEGRVRPDQIAKLRG
jgi:hypothetical protein